jgi:hypothetical protein
MIDPDIYREASACLAHDLEAYEDNQGARGMCVAIIDALGAEKMSDADPYLDLLSEYFRPDNPPTYWWLGVNEETQAERFMCLHFMALIAEDL